MKSITVENEIVYRKPTDEDAIKRVAAQAKDRGDTKWVSGVTLLAVLDADQGAFVVLNNGFCEEYDECRIDTGIYIPDGWRLVDHGEAWQKGAKFWDGEEWSKQSLSCSRWFDDSIYILPIDPEKPEPKYRPFQSWQEWWPHRERWVVTPPGPFGDHIVKTEWMSANSCEARLTDGWRFCNEDGTPGEPYGVKIE